jgi:hypothetical protein
VKAWILLLLGVASLGACTSSDTADATDVADDTATLDTSVPEVVAADAAGTPETLTGLDLSGTWAQLDVRSALATVPMAGQVTRTTTSLFLVTLSQAGNLVDVTQRLCALESDSGTDLVQTVFPDALVASIAEQSFQATLTQEDGLVAYREAPHVDVRGCHLDDEEADDLPTAEDDPRVVDQDGDGRPGITVRITGVVNGDVWLVQRLRSQASGTLRSADRVEGVIAWNDEQHHLGTDNPLLKDPTPSQPDPVAEHSFFRMVRVPAGSDCAGLIAARDTLLAPQGATP